MWNWLDLLQNTWAAGKITPWQCFACTSADGACIKYILRPAAAIPFSLWRHPNFLRTNRSEREKDKISQKVIESNLDNIRRLCDILSRLADQQKSKRIPQRMSVRFPSIMSKLFQRTSFHHILQQNSRRFASCASESGKMVAIRDIIFLFFHKACFFLPTFGRKIK